MCHVDRCWLTSLRDQPFLQDTSFEAILKVVIAAANSRLYLVCLKVRGEVRSTYC